MKRAIIYFTLISVALLSCKKDNRTKTNTDINGKLYPVTFNISNFTQENSPITQSSKTQVNAVAPDASNVLKLMYKLYDASNTLKKTIIIKKGEPAFGTVKDSLAAGNYTAVFVGLTDTLHFVDKGETFDYYTPPAGPSAGGRGFYETFYKKITFTVGSVYLIQSVVLERPSSELLVNIKDAIPAGVGKITVSVTGLHSEYSYFEDKSLIFDARTALLATAVPANKIGTTNFQLGPITNLLNTTGTLTVTIYAEAPNGTNVAQKLVSNVQLQRNTRIILSGNLFSNGADTHGFTVTYNPTYAGAGSNQNF
jgi:hypothetical protein